MSEHGNGPVLAPMGFGMDTQRISVEPQIVVHPQDQLAGGGPQS